MPDVASSGLYKAAFPFADDVPAAGRRTGSGILEAIRWGRRRTWRRRGCRFVSENSTYLPHHRDPSW